MRDAVLVLELKVVFKWPSRRRQTRRLGLYGVPSTRLACEHRLSVVSIALGGFKSTHTSSHLISAWWKAAGVSNRGV